MKVKLNNVGIISNCEVEFVTGVNLVIGNSGSGKSTLMRCIYNVAANDFADSDISFGKNTMSVRVDHDDNTIEYTRSIKSKDDKCSYVVNGEKYVKLGRQPLPAVKNLLKIGNVNVNGEDVNFNFNLQFSSPFLILGSQSTLYNVLTYRSNFDISSINDYYATDIRKNATETATDVKLKEQLKNNLESLKKQADLLSPIENLYSNLVDYKHKNNALKELELLYDSMISLDKCNSKSKDCSTQLNIISNCISKIESVIELTSYNNTNKSIKDCNNKIDLLANLVSDTEYAMNKIHILSDINKCSKLLLVLDSTCDNIKTINKCLNTDTNITNDLVNDIIKVYKLHLSLNKYNESLCTLQDVDNLSVNSVCDLIEILRQLNNLSSLNERISSVDSKIKVVDNRMSEFEACPLCGCNLKNCISH